MTPLFGLGQQGKSATVTSQRHVNVYVEFSDDKTQFAFYGTPGLTLRKALGDTPCRGWISIDNLYYVVHRDKLISVNNAGTQVELGTLNTSTGRVDMAYDGTRILIVDGTNGYTLTVSTSTFAQIGDSDFPNGANTCAWLDGQFIVDSGDGSEQFFTSANATSWDALDFASAESAPDGIVRVFVNGGELLILGDNTTEPWGNVGASDFTFAAIKGGISNFGLAARWSLTAFNSSVAGVMKNENGQAQVMFLNGYIWKPISSQEVDSIINGYSTVADATAFAYMLGGHPMLQVNFPSGGASWLYDMSTNMWSRLEYGLDGERHRGEMQLEFLGKTLISDYEDGNIYDLDSTVYTDNEEPIAREIVGKHFFRDNDRVTVDELYLDMETGVGLQSGQGSDPQVMLQVSKDNGHTWGAELWTSLGAIGDYLARVEWRRLGIARNWTFKIRLTDPVKFVLSFAALRVRA